MPQPTPSETRAKFIPRCISMVLADGSAKDNEQAVAMCYGMWEQHDRAELAEARTYRPPATVVALAQRALDDGAATADPLTRRLAAGSALALDDVRAVALSLPDTEAGKWAARIIRNIEIEPEIEMAITLTPLADGPLAFDLGESRSAALKDIVRDGVWTGGNGVSVTITPERRAAWVRQFAAMKAAGVHVPVVSKHDGSGPLGSVEDMALAGDSIVAAMSFPDADAERAATRARFVSIGTDPNFEDGARRRYGEVIRHVCITAEPAIPAQGDYVALSLTPAPSDTPNPAAPASPQEPPRPPSESDDPMDKQLPIALGLAEDATPEAVLAKAQELVAAAAADKAALAAAQAKLAAVPAAPAALSRESVTALSDAFDHRLQALVAAGTLAPASAARVREVLAGKAEAPNAVALSRAEGQAVAPAFAVLDLIAELKPGVATGEATGAQVRVELSRDQNADETAAAKKAADERSARMAAHACPATAAAK